MMKTKPPPFVLFLGGDLVALTSEHMAVNCLLLCFYYSSIGVAHVIYLPNDLEMRKST